MSTPGLIETLARLQHECLNMLFYGSAMRFPPWRSDFKETASRR